MQTDQVVSEKIIEAVKVGHVDLNTYWLTFFSDPSQELEADVRDTYFMQVINTHDLIIPVKIIQLDNPTRKLIY